MSHKSWVYTINNYTEEDIEKLKLLTTNKHRCCKEVGESGTPHLQGAITFKRSYKLKQLKKIFETAHWEIALCKDAENYCIKGDIIINENNTKQGKRSDLAEACETLKEGLLPVTENHPTIYVKYHKGLQSLRDILSKKDKEFTKINVIVYQGKPGCGKTRKAYEIDNDLYNVPEPINGSLWFDGYDQEKTILLDDFYGWIKYHTLLQLLDGYPIKLPIKGGFTYKKWNTVIITSNKKPKEWYNRDEWEALKRRITSCYPL